jgi:hypothetical protein
MNGGRARLLLAGELVTRLKHGAVSSTVKDPHAIARERAKLTAVKPVAMKSRAARAMLFTNDEAFMEDAMEHVMKWEEPRLRTQGAGARAALLAILAFEALGALLGGQLLVLAPDGAWMKIPLSDLHGAFPDFFIPGAILTALGALNAIAFFALLRRKPSAWLWVGLALGGFVVWFAVELAICGFQSWAQAAWGVPVPIGVLLALPLAAERLRRARH